MPTSPLDQALRHHQAGELDKALSLYLEILRNDANNTDILHLLGILYAQLTDYDTAKSFLEKAIRIQPHSPSFHNSLGNVYKHLGNYTKARTEYEQAIQLNPHNATALNNLGNILYQQDNYQDASQHYQAAIRLKPDYVDAHYNLGLCYVRLNDQPAAQQSFEKTIHYQPDHDQAHNQLGQIYQQQQKYTEARQHYQKCLTIYPEQTQVLHNLATNYLSEGNKQDAIECFVKTITLDPKHREAHFNLGALFICQHKLDLALKHYLQLLSISPEVDVYYNIAVIYMYQDHHQDAINYFKHALKLDRTHFPSLVNLASTYLKINKYKKAQQYYEEALALSPDHADIKYVLAAIKGDQTPTIAPKNYLKNLFDEYAYYFDKHLTEYLHYQVPELIYQAVMQQVASDATFSTVLDLGCGSGLAAEKFKDHAETLIGIDISDKMLEVAKQKNIYSELHNLDIEHALQRYTENELIIAADVFVYLGDLATVLELAKAALIPHGLFAFTVEKSNIQPYHLQKSARFAHHKQYIEELAAKNSFKVERGDEVVLRQQNNQPVAGWLFVLSKNTSSRGTR